MSQAKSHTPLSPLHLPGHASSASECRPDKEQEADRDNNTHADLTGVCLCPSWAHGPNCRSLPSPVPAQAIQQPKNKRALPTWSRNKTSLHTGRPKALTPEPGQGAFSKVLCEPFGDSAGGGLSSSWAHVDSVRLHGSYPRLIGADSEVVLWDLRRAQQALADIQHKLAHREIDLQESSKRMRGWILARCRHMQRHRAMKQQSKLFRDWFSSTTLGKLSRKLHTDLAEAHERELNLQQQLAEERHQHERVATAMARRIHQGEDRILGLEHEMQDLRTQALEATASKIQAEEAASAKILELKEDLARESERVKSLEETLSELEHELNALKKSMKMAERKHAQELTAVRALVNELDDSEALGNRLLRQQVLHSSGHATSARKLSALQAYLMHQEDGIEAVRKSNAKMSQASPDKVAIFARKESFWAGLEAFNGRLMARSDEQLLEQMRLEFLQCKDPSIRQIRISEDGSCTTDLSLEWEFAECPVPGKLYLGSLRHPNTTNLAFSRSPATLIELMQSDMAQRAGLSRPEVLAARLFTGPCHKVINSALRQGRFVKGKRECPRYAYFNMSALIKNVLEIAGAQDWKASFGVEWTGIWKFVTEELNWSSMFSVKMTEATQAIQLEPTCAVFVKAASKRIVIVDVTLEGDFWEPWPEAAGVFIKKHDDEGDVTMKQERKRRVDLERKRRIQEENRRKLEENEENKRQVYAALKGDGTAGDGAESVVKVDSMQVDEQEDEAHESHVVEGSECKEASPVEREDGDVEAARSDMAKGELANEAEPETGDGGRRDCGQENAGESKMGKVPFQHVSYSRAQDRNARLMQKLRLLLGDDWEVQVCPVIGETFGVKHSLAKLNTENMEKAITDIEGSTDSVPDPLLPMEWCCEGGQEDECECVGCIHELCKALETTFSSKSNLARAVLDASVVAGCGRKNYGACQDTAGCHACKQGELWKCPYQEQACANCAPGVDSFSCTISVLNSAVAKLCSVSPPPPGDLVFRGINGLAIPAELLEQTDSTHNEGSMDGTTHHTYTDFVEHGFCSVTSRKEEALQHAGALQCESCCGGVCKFWVAEDSICTEHRATIFEIETSSNNRCADLSWASQWSSIDDRVLLPAAHFEIKGMRREDNVNYIRIAFNANAKAHTLDDLRASRYHRFLDIAEELKQEGRHLLESSEFVNDQISAAVLKIKAEILEGGVASAEFQPGVVNYFNTPMQFNAALDELLRRWTDSMLHAARWHVDHVEALMLDMCKAKGKDAAGKPDESNQLGHVGNGEEEAAQQESGSSVRDAVAPPTASPELARLYASIEASRKHQQDAQAKADLLDEAERISGPALLEVPSSYAKLANRRSRSVELMQTTADGDLTQAYRIFEHIGFYASEPPAEQSSKPGTRHLQKKRVRQEVLRLFGMQIRKSLMCEDAPDVTAALYGDQADILRQGCHSDLNLAFECYSKALNIFGEKHPRAPEFLFRRTQIGVILRQMDGQVDNFDDLLKDYMTCLGLIAQKEKALPPREGDEGSSVASWHQNSEDDRRHLLMLKSDIHEQVGVLFSSHFPDKMSAAPLSLLEALRTQMDVQGFPNPATLLHMREVIDRLNQDSVLGAGEQAEQGRLMPCSVFQILVNAQDSNTLQLSFLTDSLKKLPRDALATIYEWGLSCLHCILQTEGVELTWQEVALTLEALLKAVFYHGKCENVAKEACRAFAEVFRRSNAWSQFQEHAPKRFLRTHRKIVTCCNRILHLHKYSSLVVSEVLPLVRAIVIDEVRFTYLQSPQENDVKQIGEISRSVLFSLDVLRDNPLATVNALEILCMEGTRLASIGSGALDRFEEIVADIAEAQDESSEQGRKIRELCRACLHSYSGYIQRVKVERDYMQAQFGDASVSENQNAQIEQDDKPFVRTAWEAHLKAALEALNECLFDTSRKAIERAANTLKQTGCYRDKEQEVWQLSHQVASHEAIHTAKSRLADGDARGAKTACEIAHQEFKKMGRVTVDMTNQLEEIELDIAAAQLEAQAKEAHARHKAAAEAALGVARSALATLDVRIIEIAFEQTLSRAEDVSKVVEDVGEIAEMETALQVEVEQVDEHSAERKNPAVEKIGEKRADMVTGVTKEKAREDSDPDGAGAAKAHDARAASETLPEPKNDEKADEHEHHQSVADSDLPQLPRTLLQRIAEVQGFIMEAENEFDKSGGCNSTWRDLEEMKLSIESLLQAACGVLAKRVHGLLYSGRVDAAHRTVAAAYDDFMNSGFEDRLDYLRLEDLVVHIGEVRGLIDIAGQALTASEASPTYWKIKPVHERLVRAALLIEKHLPCDQDTECLHFGSGSIHHELQGLHVRCGDALVQCPRPLAVETRAVYHMARRQFQLAGLNIDGNIDGDARGAAMSRFFDELSSWEGGGVEVEVLNESAR